MTSKAARRANRLSAARRRWRMIDDDALYPTPRALAAAKRSKLNPRVLQRIWAGQRECTARILLAIRVAYGLTSAQLLLLAQELERRRILVQDRSSGSLPYRKARQLDDKERHDRFK